MLKPTDNELQSNHKLQSNSYRINTGDLLAWKNDGTVLGNLVAYLTHGEYTHVGIAWVHHSRPYVIDAYWKGGVRLRALSTNLPCDHIPLNLDWNSEIEDVTFSKLGNDYHYLGAAMVGFNIVPNYDAHVCSIFAAQIIRKGGISIPEDIALTPQRLVNIMTKVKDISPRTISELNGVYYEFNRVDELSESKRVS